MKNLTYNLLISAILLATASCNQGSLLTLAETSSVEFRIALPDGLQTRSDEASDETLLKWSVFEIKEGEQKQLVESDQQTVSFSDAQTSVPITLQLLQGRKYRVAFAVTNSANTFATFEDGVLTVNYEGVTCNTDNDDIFIGKSDLLDVSGDASETTISLYRPFSQLNWSTSDLNHKQVSENIDNISASVSVSGDIYRTLDILDNTYGEKVEHGLTFSGIALSNANIPLAEEESYSNIATNYLLIKDEEEQQTLDCIIHFDGHTDVTVNVNNASAKPNFRTNIFGALLTNDKSVSITMEEGFANNKYTGISENDVIENILAGDYVIEEGKTVDFRRYKNLRLRTGQKLTVNGTLIVGPNTFLVDENVNDVVIDGSGTISLNDYAENVFVVNKDASLTIENVTISNGDADNVFVVNSGGTLNLNDLTISCGDAKEVLIVNSGATLKLDNVNISSSVKSTINSVYIIRINGGKLIAENTEIDIQRGFFNVMNNGNVSLTDCNVMIPNYTDYNSIIQSGSTVSFNNCTMSSAYCNVYMQYGELLITGDNGSYTSTSISYGIIYCSSSYTNSKLTIEGGKFKASYYPLENPHYIGTVILKGGYYNKSISNGTTNWKDSYIPDGYELITNSTTYSGYPYEIRKKEEVTE